MLLDGFLALLIASAWIAYLRGHGIKALITVQSLSQLYEVYGCAFPQFPQARRPQ